MVDYSVVLSVTTASDGAALWPAVVLNVYIFR